MKLLNLHLIRFGLFTNLDINLATGRKRFHVIFGSNEAGKSTVLRAVMGLLFGIPETTLDDHVHKKADLRIGARLEGREGKQLQVIRRKGRKKTLLDIEGNVLDESILTPLLQGVGRELFETMFGLSHEALVRGGQDLLSGKGELGESLFGAGIGVRSIHSLRTSLCDKAEAIFTPGAHKRPLNLALKTFQEAKRKIVQFSLKPKGWEDLQAKLQKARKQLKTLEQERQDVSAALNRLKRLQRALPQVRKQEELIGQKNLLGEVKLVHESSTEERIKAQHILDNADVQVQKLIDEKDQCERDLAKLDVPEKLLAREDALEDLRDRLGAHKKAMQDLPALSAEVASDYQDARLFLRELGRVESLDKVDRLRIDVATRARIRALAQKFALLDIAQRKAEKDLIEVDRTLQDLKRQNEKLPRPQDANVLRRIVVSIRKRGDLDTQLHKLTCDIEELEAKAENKLSGILLWKGSLDEIEGIPLPPEETLKRFQTKFRELDKRREHVEAKKTDLVKDLERVDSNLVELEARGTVTSEDELKSVRTARDEIWRQIRNIWIDGDPTLADAPGTLAAEYESKVRKADDTADRLWHDADRAAKHSTLSTERKRYETEYTGFGQQLAEIGKDTDLLENQWRELWKPARIEPLPPGEMRGWLDRHEKLADSVAQLRKYKQEQNMLLQEIREFRNQCNQELTKLGQRAPTGNESLSDLLDQAEEVVDSLDATERTRNQVLRDLEKSGTSRENQQKEHERSQEALEQWRSNWGRAVQVIGIDSNAATEEAEAILNTHSQLFQKIDAGRRDQTRIDRIKSDARQFADGVATLAREFAPDLDGTQAEEAAVKLVNRLKIGKEALKDRDNLNKRLQQILKELNSLKREREGAQATIDRLMESACCNTPEELEQVERQSKEYRDIVSKLKDLEEQLLGEGIPLKELIEQAQAVDPDTLPSEIQRLEGNCNRLVNECDQLREEVGSLKNELGSMDGVQEAADAAVEAQETLAAIRYYVETYTRTKLAALLLDREIKRYREENQGPVLQRAGEILRHITLGAFVGLTSGFGAGDQLILLCIRNNEEKVPVEGLSDGTRDQLYLSLRLASIERHVAHNEPLPLIIDDVLINFDDRRAQATLELLSHISEKTQVLFFTHHARLLELARDSIPKNLLKEHNLGQMNATCAR